MKLISLVAFGGALGSVFRYMISLWLKPAFAHLFPWNTFVVNLLGCALIGACIAWFSTQKNPDIQLFITVGILGGFTTFSGFGLELFSMVKAKAYLPATYYVLGSNIGGLLAVYSGYNLINYIR